LCREFVQKCHNSECGYQLILEVTIIANARNFVLRDEDGNEHGVFTGKQPRQAALKAANKATGQKRN
jgi:hypothetical protein